MTKAILTTLTPLYVILFLTGCTAGLVDPEIDFEPPAYVEQMPSKEDKKDFTSTGSIFGQGENPLFSDHKAMHVNDIVRVVISETAKSSSTGAKSLSENEATTFTGGAFTTGGANSSVASVASKLNGFANIGYTSKNDSSYKGAGSATKDASFTTTVSARIVKVLQNGNYFISGRREILIDEQKQVIQISGVIRPYDITPENTIYSHQLANLKIKYVKDGEESDVLHKPWGTKIIEAIWPF